MATAENLDGHGLQREQAKALATRGDLAELESRLTDKMASRQRWYVGLPFVAAGLAVAAMKLV